MCTLTFIPKPNGYLPNGYLLGMNRDERLTREVALAPEQVTISNLPAVYPRENGGGTWIGSNATGITFALLNQNPGPQAKIKERSRGEIIPALLESSRFPQAMRCFQHLDLHGMLSFVLVGIFPAEQIISQCQWNGNELTFLRIGWDVRHWFSSGVSDDMARKIRGSTSHVMKLGDAATQVLPNGCADFTLRTRRYAGRSAFACIVPTRQPSALQKFH
jgi:hypothetical protein